ncbi:MAG TPA: aspartate-semialdehyde dehydrogenase [Acidobacteriota bacterium]|nr:aspartate-semialdehyde dehydrogenase [Acidobacteriota bacterium]HQM64498.1 aspartate-semialdehyde dehydrogenase [Acidobacteriota bacterium]
MRKIPVGILGATGVVGQRFVQLLADHPWFSLCALAASDRSAGRTYAEACRWLLPGRVPEAAAGLEVWPLEPELDCRLVFSALPADVAGSVEERFAAAGYAVSSNTSAHRMDADVPLLIPEVNPGHTALIEEQRRRRGWSGCIVAAPNCSSTQVALTLKPLHDAFGLQRVSVVTLQAVSGAGYPGLSALDILDNVIPFIDGEEDKLEREPAKLLGRLNGVVVVPAAVAVSAQCNRVPVRDGHTACVALSAAHAPSAAEAATALAAFRAAPEVAALPSTPPQPVEVLADSDRPQPVRDRDRAQGMTVAVGRLRPCPLLGLKFVVLGHNTIRGAAGGAVHNAELLAAQGWLS